MDLGWSLCLHECAVDDERAEEFDLCPDNQVAIDEQGLAFDGSGDAVSAENGGVRDKLVVAPVILRWVDGEDVGALVVDVDDRRALPVKHAAVSRKITD